MTQPSVSQFLTAVDATRAAIADHQRQRDDAQQRLAALLARPSGERDVKKLKRCERAVAFHERVIAALEARLPSDTGDVGEGSS